jgi:hypothetical protein
VSKPSLRRAFEPPGVRCSIRLPHDLARWIDEQAAARSVNRTKHIHDMLAAQRDIQEQLAESFTLGPAGGSGKQILHALLTQHKEEIARSVDRQAGETAQLRRQFTTLLIMADCAALLAMEPRQYDAWRERVRAEVGRASGKREAAGENGGEE